VRRTRFNRWPCPIARAADVFGDGWTQIVMREAFYGRRRFEDFQQSLGMSRATLGQRLNRLVSEGMLDKVPYQSRPARYEYRLTEKGRSFFDVLAAMWRFGEDWLFRQGPPVRLVDRQSGDEIRPVVVDEHSGRRIDLGRIRVELRDGTPLDARDAGKRAHDRRGTHRSP
jgi:DNA-binding HxlR family transcriptional regulator